MVDLHKKFATSKTAELEGVKVEVEGAIFIIKRAGGHNRAYRYAVSKYAMPHRAKFEEYKKTNDVKIAAEIEDQINLQAFADEAIVGWEKVDGPDGQPIPFSRDNFVNLMEACPDVWDTVRIAAQDIDNFREVVQKDGEALGES